VLRVGHGGRTQHGFGRDEHDATEIRRAGQVQISGGHDVGQRRFRHGTAAGRVEVHQRVHGNVSGPADEVLRASRTQTSRIQARGHIESKCARRWAVALF